MQITASQLIHPAPRTPHGHARHCPYLDTPRNACTCMTAAEHDRYLAWLRSTPDEEAMLPSTPQFPPAPERAPHIEPLANALRRAQRAGIPIGAAQFEPAPHETPEQKHLGNLLALGAAAALLHLAAHRQ